MQINEMIKIISKNKVSTALLMIIFCLIILLLLCLRDKKTKPIEKIKKEEKKEEPISLPEINSEELAALKDVTQKLEALKKPKLEDEVVTYEAEQEEKAIISYEELLSQTQNVSISYSESETNDDITIKKVDLEKTNKIELDPIKKAMNSKVSMSQYEHEEDFLNTLKQLQNLIN